MLNRVARTIREWFSRNRRLAVGGVLLLAAGLVAAVLLTGGDEGAEAQSEDDHGSGTAVTRWTDQMEIFFENPPMVAGQTSEPWAVHVTQLAGYEPVRSGSLTLRFRGPDGNVYSMTADSTSQPGIFTPAPQLPKAGTYELLMEVNSPQVSGRALIGELAVYESAEAAPHGHGAGGGISYLKEEQWESGFGVAQASTQSIPYSVEMSGEVVPTSGRTASVSAPVSGLVRAPGNIRAPAPGDRVEAGQALAVLSPLEGESSFTELKSKVERLRREVSRLERLYEVRAIPEKRLIETRAELDAAEAALSSMGGGGSSGYNYVVRAPIAGVVDRRFLKLGARVAAGDSLFSIVNPEWVWLKMRVPAEHASRAESASGAVFRPEGGEFYRAADEVVSVGSVIDRKTRTLPVLLAAHNSGGRLKLGMYVDGRLQLGEERTGVAIPNAAIQREDGQAYAFVQTGGETFQRRSLTLGPVGEDYTIVQQGIEEGEYVVTEGAYQVQLASLNADEAVQGHGHPH